MPFGDPSRITIAPSQAAPRDGAEADGNPLPLAPSPGATGFKPGVGTPRDTGATAYGNGGAAAPDGKSPPVLWSQQQQPGGVSAQPIYNLVITGSLLTIVPIVVAFLVLQRFWQSGLASGGLK